MKERILMIEDDQVFVKMIQRALSNQGYLIEIALDGEQGLMAARNFRPDLVILDWMLPGIDGITVCQRLRVEGRVPILMLTGKDHVQDRIQGLDSGADDYLVKPVELGELLARIRALLRRTQQERAAVLAFADLTLDASSRMAHRGDREIALTAKEYELLELMMRFPQKVLSRELIYERVWGYDFGGESNVLDVYIRYLREKLESSGEPRLIYTARGVGYVLKEK